MRGLQCVQGLQYIRGLRCVPDLAMVPRVLMSSSRLRPTCSSTPAQPLRHGSRQDALPAAARLRAPQADGRLGPWPKPGRAMCRLAARSRRQSAGGKKLGQPEASRKATESRQAATHPRVLDHNRVGLLVGADTDLQLCRRRQHCANAQQADPPPAKPAPYPPTHAQHRPHTRAYTHTQHDARRVGPTHRCPSCTRPPPAPPAAGSCPGHQMRWTPAPAGTRPYGTGGKVQEERTEERRDERKLGSQGRSEGGQPDARRSQEGRGEGGGAWPRVGKPLGRRRRQAAAAAEFPAAGPAATAAAGSMQLPGSCRTCWSRGS